MHPAVKPNGDKYWEYVLCNVNDILAISHDPKTIMKDLGVYYTLKLGSIKEPDQYLGAQVHKFHINNTKDPDKT